MFTPVWRRREGHDLVFGVAAAVDLHEAKWRISEREEKMSRLKGAMNLVTSEHELLASTFGVLLRKVEVRCFQVVLRVWCGQPHVRPQALTKQMETLV